MLATCTELESCLHGSGYRLLILQLTLGGLQSVPRPNYVDQFSPNLSNADNMNDTVLVNYSNRYYRALLSIKYERCNGTKTDCLAFYSQLPCNSELCGGVAG